MQRFRLMGDFFKRYPIHPWLVALYPVTALLAHNTTEVPPSAASRPVLLSLALASLIFLFCWLLIRNTAKAALLASVLLVLFFSYGHVYQFLHTLGGSLPLGRHRYLGLLYLGILTLAAAGIWRLRGTAVMTQAVNLAAIVLLALPLFSLVDYYGLAAGDTHRVRAAGAGESLVFSGHGTPPDVYFILLDTYMRADALKRDMHFDNSQFVKSLQDMGFYVATCSRPNYDYTRASLTSTLNMDYLPALQQELKSEGISDPEALWALLLNSKTRRLLEGMGYRTAAFQTTFEWSTMKDADIYLAPDSDLNHTQMLLPFEAMFLNSTAATILVAWDARSSFWKADIVKFLYQQHVETELYLLDTLPKLVKVPGPKFVFVHILIPHVPYVFEPDGTVRVNPDYYSAGGANAINWTYQRNGYVDSVQFINNRMLPILKTLIDESPTPPIIIMEGDHGLTGHDRTENLSTYYLPGVQNKGLYPTISPVNSLRVVFNDYFGADYALLPDLTYRNFKLGVSDGLRTPEFEPECQP